MIKRICEYCKEEYETYPSIRKRFCSLECWNLYSFEVGLHKGKNNPMYGKTKSEEWKQAHSKLMKEHWKHNENPFKNKKHTMKTKLKMLLSHKNSLGDKNPNWKNGKSRPYSRSLMKGKNICEACGIYIKGNFRHIHHKDGDPTNNNLSNLMVLCAKCHKNKHTKEMI